jgi:uncharacterized protein
MKFTRRTFVKTAAVFGASEAVHGFGSIGQHDDKEPLRQFDYAQVRLKGGPFADQYDALHAHYLALNNDRLLKVYRQRAGLPAPGADMGGWYDFDGFVPGHSLGQYISGLARIGASTGDVACHEKVHTLVEGFAETLGLDNQSILRPKTNLWICYTLDKHFAGLIDAGVLSNVPQAKELLNRVLAGTKPLLPVKGRDRIGKKDPPYDETFVMPENLFTAAQLTGNPAFDELARRYLLDREFFDPLARGEDPFPGQHAYSHAIALSSGAGAYLVLGDAKYKQAVQHAFTLLTTEQQFASGGWGPNETFITPHKGQLYDALSTTVDHFETPCGAYAATKLARYLTRLTASPADTRHGDNLERVLYNTILAAKLPDSDGDYPYYSTYSPVAKKVFYQSKWPCCSGTLVQTVGDYPLNIYFKSEDGLYLSQYISSELHFKHDGVSIVLMQNTDLPSGDSTSISVKPTSPVSFTIYLRIPAWVDGAAKVLVNGKVVASTPTRGTYVAIRRTWRDGDQIAATLPQSFRTEAIDDRHSDTVALIRGPVQYVALNQTKELGAERLALPAGLKQIAPQVFVENYGGTQVVFVPLYRVRNETYTTYFSKG